MHDTRGWRLALVDEEGCEYDSVPVDSYYIEEVSKMVANAFKGTPWKNKGGNTMDNTKRRVAVGKMWTVEVGGKRFRFQILVSECKNG